MKNKGDFQEDEIEFTNPVFLKIYYEIIQQLNQGQVIDIDLLINNEDIEIASKVTSILMDEEKHVLSDWERHDIIPKKKVRGLPKFVPDVIYNFRGLLVEEKINTLKELTKTTANTLKDSQEILVMVNDYSELRILLSEKLNRVV